MLKDVPSINILDIPINILSKKEVKLLINRALDQKIKPLFIATVNPSFILKSIKNKNFKEILCYKTAINTADGVGIQLAAEYIHFAKKSKLQNMFKGILIGLKHTFFSKKFSLIKDRITGVYITRYVLKYAEINKHSVLIVMRKNGLSSPSNVKAYIEKNYKNLNYTIIKLNINEVTDTSEVKEYDIVLVGLGEVIQETFIDSLKNDKYKVAIGIGGTFDILTDKIPHSPSIFSKVGLDWLYRFFHHPKRFIKVVNSVLIFPIKVFLNN